MLTIEKVVKLLDDHYYDILTSHLNNSNAEIPLKLIHAINRDIEVEQSSDILCEIVYGNADDKSKRKFFQLAHHTFRLTSFLSKNYPYYLLPNISKIQGLINGGNLERGVKIMETTADVARKVEENKTLSILLDMLSQQAHLQEAYAASNKYHQELQEVLEYEKQISEIYAHLGHRFSAKKRPTKIDDITTTLAFFEQFKESKSFPVRILSRYGHCYALYFLNRNEFYSQEVFDYLNDIEEQVRKYNYIVFPYLEDLSFKVSYLKARYLLHKMDIPLVMEESQSILDKSGDLLFWKSFINSPEIFAIAFQVSFYSTNFLAEYICKRSDDVPKDVKNKINELRERCLNLLNGREWTEDNRLKQIILRSFYGGLGLVCEDLKEVEKSVSLMETTLVEYQQIPFHFHIDAYMAMLVIGYFRLEKYENAAASYKRYKKLSEGKAVNPENDMTVHAFYYASQWMHTGRKQYASKFKSMIEKANTPQLEPTRKLLVEVAKHINIPILDVSAS